MQEKGKEDLATHVSKNKNGKRRWKNVKVLVIDEISMLSGDFFDKLEFVARRVRKSDLPFGGVQLLLCGDFLQLPPVEKDSTKSYTYAFESGSWETCVNICIQLKKVFRQIGDDTFVNLLNEIRVGNLTQNALQLLQKSCVYETKLASNNNKISENVEATKLFPLKKDVESENIRRLALISEKSVYFEANDTSKFGPTFIATLDKSCPAPKTLELKVNK